MAARIYEYLIERINQATAATTLQPQTKVSDLSVAAPDE